MKKRKWGIGVGAAMLLLLLLIVWYYFGYLLTGTQSRDIRDKTNGNFDIADIQSSVDMDGDGIDDQTDILQGARAYIKTNPKYKSKYYQTGYPDDEYGVCTDVVANAMGNAGYDLQALVDADIRAHPGDYDIRERDPNIDFRRVRNLKVFFHRTAIELSTDPADIDQWQGGDIVIFTKHIGVVSENRNDRGVAYVIHHNGPRQRSYEEDILETRNDIEAHYRVSE